VPSNITLGVPSKPYQEKRSRAVPIWYGAETYHVIGMNCVLS